MTNLTANVNNNSYFWLEGSFDYYDDTNPTTLNIAKPPEINGVDLAEFETWIEVNRRFNAQTSRDFSKVTDGVYEITADNPKGTILTIKFYFINPASEEEIATNAQNIQFGINKTSGVLPPSAIPETKILDKAFIDFVIVGKAISFYNILGEKVSEGAFNDLLNWGDLKQPDWNQTDIGELDFIKNKPEWVRGVVQYSEIGNVFESGIYLVEEDTEGGDVYYQILFVTSIFFNGGYIGNCIQYSMNYTSDVFLQMREYDTVTETWTAWETCALLSDLTPILSDIVTLQGKAINADWNQNDSEKADFIKNKPVIKPNYPLVPKTGTSGTLDPNTVNVWGNVTSLNITLNAPITGYVSEYVFIFSTGATAPTLTVPSTWKWLGGSPITIDPNKTYQISVIYDGAKYLAVGGEF